MAIYLRLIPEWRHFAVRLEKAIQEREHQSHVNHSDKEETIYQDVHPSVQFHFSCPPSDHLHCITAYTGRSGNMVMGFQWSQTVIKHQIDIWQDDGHGGLSHHSTIPVYGRYKIERMLFVPNQRVLVGYCNDMCLRVLTDNTQEMVVLYHTQCPASVISMHYCPETNELLTGSMGLIAFWGFWTSAQTPLSLLRILDWTKCSIERETVVSAFVSQRQTKSIYALCDRNIKNFEHTGKHELLEFRGQSIASLRCVVAEWRQRYLYTGDADGYVQVWSCDMRRLFLQFRAHATAVTSVVLLAEAGSILTASTGCWIKQWTRSGDLLLKLHIDMPGGVQTMWQLGRNAIMCQSSTSLDVWHLNSIYRSFNDTACSVRVLRRIECSRGKGRILAVTLDGIIRFLSPVTGELLFLSWPFLHIDKALSFAYNPNQEELYVCDGSVEVLVLNTTLSPCPVKHIINTVKEGNDGVLCMETVMVWSSKGGTGDESPLCLVFSGHRNGKLQLLAPLNLFCEPQKAHNGVLYQMSSLSGDRPSICCYGSDCQFTVWSVRLESNQQVYLTREAQISCDFTPVHSRLMQGFICAVSPRQNLVFYSIRGERRAESERKKSERISCLDYCPQLDILALTGESGKIEIWNHEGDLVAEVKLGVPVTQVCFGNSRGDILASFADSISIILVTHILPARYLRTVLRQAPTDDVVEPPIPFLPKSLSHYDMSLVPKIYLKYLKLTKENVIIEPTPDQTITESLSEDSIATMEQEEQTSKSVIKPYTPRVWRKSGVRTARKPQGIIPKVELHEESAEEVPVEGLSLRKSSMEDILSIFCHIARDGYIPNSVIRAMHTEEVEEEEEVEGEEDYEGYNERYSPPRDYEVKKVVAGHTQAIQDILTRAKVTRTVNAQQVIFKPETNGPKDEQAQDDGQGTCEMLEEKQQQTKQVQTLLENLSISSEFAYKDYCAKLMDLLKSLQFDENLRNQLKSTFLSHTSDPSLLWRQQEGLRNLQRLELLHGDDIGLVCEFLLNPAMRDLALNILKEVYKISGKEALKNELLKTMSLESLETLLGKLNDNLEFIVDAKPKPQTSLKTKQQIKTRDAKGSKTHRRSSIRPEENKSELKQISQEHEDPQKERKFSRAVQGTSEVSDKEEDECNDKEMKKTQRETHMISTSTTWYHTPKLAQKTHKKKAFKLKSKKDNLRDREGSGAPNDPLLYAFRKARKYSPITIPPVDLGPPKNESHLLPSDSGLGSLTSQEVSSEKVPSVGTGAFLPLRKPKRVSQYYCYESQHPEHVSQHPHYVYEHHDDMTTQHPLSSTKLTQHTDQNVQHIIHHPQHIYQHPQNISQNAPRKSQHPQDISQNAPRISQHPQRKSQHPQDISQNAPRISQHPQRISQHPQHKSQHPQDISQNAPRISQHPQRRSQHPRHISQHPRDISQNAPRISQHPRHISQHPRDISQHPQHISQHPRHISQRPRHISQHCPKIIQDRQYTSQHPEPISQQSPPISPPHPPGFISDSHEKLSELGLTFEEGEPHWRESLHKLISLNGFRSKKAARQAALLCAQPLRLQACMDTGTQILPPLQPQPHWQGALGERVTQSMEMTGTRQEPSPTKFQHELPLPWRLGHYPLNPQGQVKYGKLEMDWVRTDDIAVCQAETIRLPKINTKGSLIQA